MKNFLLFSSLVCVVLFTACGPAAEDRQMMHTRAKIFQDSIANIIRMSMAEAEAPGNIVVAAPATTTASAPVTPAAPVQTAAQAPAPKK